MTTNFNYRLYLALLMAGISASSAMSIPADPQLRTVRQADGSEITVSMLGDEYGHSIFDSEGRRVEYDPASGMFREIPLSSPRRGMPARLKKPQRVRINNFPTVGRQKTLVVLLEFSDLPFMSVDDPYDYFYRMLNEEGFTWSNGADGSARDFYLASSDGKFDPEFVVAGPVTLSHEATWYGEDTTTQDARMGYAVKEALDALDDEIDFSQYDTDGDGVVDNIFFFYAGYGQADHPQGRDFIWPHSANVEEAWQMHLEYDGKTIGNYACSNEVRYSTIGTVEPTGIGTFVHEFGHVLGLADHYDTGYSMFAFGLGSWDTMAQGSYNNNMHTPPLFSAFERAELGWMDYTDLDLNADSLQTLPWIGCGEATGYRVKVEGKDNEWFVLENRQQTGWDRYLPGHGLLIWHVDMDEERWLSNTVNTDSQHQLLDIVEVDGIGSDASRVGDTMPGAAGISRYTLTSWDNAETVTLDDVAEYGEGADAIISILTAGSAFRLAAPAAEIVDTADESFSFTWTPVADASHYLVSVRLGEEAIEGLDTARYDAPEVIEVTGASPETDYTVSVTACRGSYASDAAPSTLTTLPLYFHKRGIEGVRIAGESSDGFTLAWDALRDADDYAVTLSLIKRRTEADTMSYGFDTKDEGMPTLWQTTSSSYHSTAGYYGEAAPSLRFMKDDDWLEVAYGEMLIDALSFWHADNGSGNILHVEAWDGTAWTPAGDVNLSKEGSRSGFRFDGAEKVRIRLEKKGGYAVIDDVEVSGRTLERTVVAGYDMALTGNTVSYTFSGLMPGETYGVTLVALCDGAASRPSAELTVTIDPAGAEAATAGAAEACGYINLEGMRSASPWPGFNIVVYTDGSMRKVMLRNAE